MVRWSLPSKVCAVALGVLVSSRVLHRTAKLGVLLATLGTLLFHRPLLVRLGGADALTASILTRVHGPAPLPPPAPRQKSSVRVLGDAPVANSKAPLLGFAIDTSQVVGGRWWSKEAHVEVGRGERHTSAFRFDRPKLRLLARELAPALLRVGGTEADHVYYNSDPVGVDELPDGYEHVFTRRHWNDLAKFVKEAGFSLLFSVNAGPGPRDEEGAWQPDNARRLMEFARDEPAGTVIWELGNELNAYWFIHGLSERVSGEQYAADLSRFSTLVKGTFPGARVAGPAGFFWPVIGEPFSGAVGIFEDYLEAGGAEADIVTWHYYPQQSRRCPVATRRASPTTLLNPRFLDEAERWANHLERLVERHAPQAELWLGETGNAQCGGEPGVSDRFASSLWYLDQLGAMALLGQPMIRQTLVGSHYGLLDPETLEPWPDYWAALLARRLLSTRALEVAREGHNAYLRIYAACTPSLARRAPGSVSMWLVNLHPELPAQVELESSGAVEWYRVTAPSLQSAEVWLNGERLALRQGRLPAVLAGPALAAPSQSENAGVLAPHSYAFAVLDAGADACL